MPSARPPLPLLLFSGGLAAVLALPLLHLAATAADGSPPNALFGEANLRLLVHTLALAGGVLAGALTLAAPLAWLVTRTDLPARRLATLVGLLPLAVPGYLTAYALLALASPASPLGIRLPRLEGYPGAWLALVLYTYPYLFLALRAGFARLDPALEEAARMLGHRPGSIFLRVVLPGLFPAIAGGGLLVVLHVFADFGVVSLMRYPTYSYAIYRELAGAYDTAAAAWLAMGLLTLVAPVLWLEARLGGPSSVHPSHRNPPRVRLGRARGLAQTLFLLVFAAGPGLPLVALLAWAGQARSALGPVAGALLRALEASLPATGLALLLALPLAYLGVRYRAGLERIAYLGFSIPPLVFGLAVATASLRFAPWLYQSVPLLVLAYAAYFLPEAVAPLKAGLARIPTRLEEASRTLGRGPLETGLRVLLPLLKPSLQTALVLVFLSGLKELPLTLLLAPPGFDTLALEVFTRAEEAQFAAAAPYALALFLAGGGMAGVLFLLEGKKR